MNLTWGDIGVMVGILAVFGTLLATIYRTKADCGNCRSACRSEIFALLNNKSEILTAVNAKLDMLLMGLNIKVERRND